MATPHPDQASLLPTETVDADHASVAAFARRHAGGSQDAREAAIALYYAVRDGIRYDPYTVRPDASSLRASATLAAGRGRQHMEYLRERGEFDDVPYDAMLETFRAHYGSVATSGTLAAGAFDQEVENEARSRLS